MTPQERLMVARVVNRLVRLPETEQDPEAVIELESLLKARRDAPYLLLQRTVLLEQALLQANEEIERLRQGGAAPEAFGRSAGAAAAHPPAAAMSGAPAAPSPGMPGSGGGFLRNAAAIGAGVLGGNLLFQGIESLLHGGSHSSFLSPGGHPVELVENEHLANPDDSLDGFTAADDPAGMLDDFDSGDDGSSI